MLHVNGRVKKEDIYVVEEVPSESLSVVSATGYAVAKGRRDKKANRWFIGSPWTPEGKSKRKRTRTSQFFQRVADGLYAPVLAMDPLAPNGETESAIFDAWYHKHLSVYKA